MKHTNPRAACGACCTQLKRLSVRLGDATVLEDISLHLHCGEMTAIIGPNGAGKTTLFRAILGQVPYQGEIGFEDAAGERIGRPRIGYVPQHLAVEPLAPVTVLDFLGAALSRAPAFLPPTKRKRALIEEALGLTGAQALAGRRLGALSGGEAQRVMLALALSPVPDLLLLDEPASGIDAEGLSAFYETIGTLRSRFDLSILLISHDLSFVHRVADRAVLLCRKVLAQGPPRRVFAGDAFAALFPAYVGAWREPEM